jgi:hypothetical protein
METRYLILLTAVIAAIGVYGIVTVQPIVALVVIALILAILFLIRYFEMHPFGFSPVSEGEAIVAAAFIALVGIIISPWIVWAAVIAILLLIQQSVVRIERQLGVLGKLKV